MLIDLKNITIGSDPEFFIVDINEEAFPSTNLLTGTKYNPEDKGNGYAILKDNVLIEGNIPPASSKEEYISNMKNLKYLMNSVLELRGLKLHSADSMRFKPRFLKHPEANEFGCSAYKNAWKPGLFSAENMNHLPFRVAGAHQHIGYQLLTDAITKKQMNKFIARAFDYFVVFPARQHFNDEFRAKYYGMYGVYRDCPAYGLECRALGGYFTQDKYLGWVYDQTIKAIEFCSNMDNLERLKTVEQPITEDLDKTLESYAILDINLEEQLIKEECLIEMM